MEKKQLKLDRPLLSVRRIPSKLLASSDEQSTKKTILPSQSSLSQVSKPVAVPFVWEQFPGRPKEVEVAESEFLIQSSSTTPRLLRGISEELMKERYLVKKSQVAATSPYDSNQESSDEMYSDVLEARSPTESFSFDCSLSGLSGHGNAELRSIGTFSTDVQTRDFMMKRFLPAAKAMVIDPPQYVSRKHSGPLDQHKQPEKIDEQRKPYPTTKPTKPNTILQKHNQETEYPESKNGAGDNNDNNYINSIKKAAKFRGLFAKFCKINSLGLLNPIPGLRAKKHHAVPTSPAKTVNRMSRSAHSGPLPRLPDKSSWNMGHVPKVNPGSKSQEFSIPKKKHPTSSNRLNFSGEIQTRGGSSSSPYQSNTYRSISPYRNQKPPSPFRGNGFVSVPKIVRNHPETNTTFKNIKPSAPTTPNIDFLSLEDEESIDEAIMAEIFYQDRSIKSRDLGSSCLSEEVQIIEEYKSTLTPPLPKSPSESWLWRTMPSLKSPFHHSQSKNQKVKEVSSHNSKWENIVKTSNKPHDYVRYSEELMPHIF